MARQFTDAAALLHDLIDRHERGTASPLARPHYQRLPVAAADALHKELRRTELAGAISIVWGKGSRDEQISHVRLAAADALYRLLGRTPIGQIASAAHARLIDGLALHPVLAQAADDARTAWSRGKAWKTFSPADANHLRSALLLAQAIVERRHEGTDYRTFSRRVTGDSKALERIEGAVVGLISAIRDLPPGAKPREALRTIGLEKFAPPLLIASRLDGAGADLSGAAFSYLGLPPNQAQRLRFREPPAYLLTIENFTSFNRHVNEADPAALGATIYVGGYPSLATQQALRSLVAMLPDTVPLFHWSDIDPDGTWIFRTIEQAVARALCPHLMSPDIAERLGKVPQGKSELRPCPRESGIFPLVEYLARDDARTLEQEELDPQWPL